MITRLSSGSKEEIHSLAFDDIAEELGFKVPYWMDAFALRNLPMALIGSPESSDEWNKDFENQPNRPAKP